MKKRRHLCPFVASFKGIGIKTSFLRQCLFIGQHKGDCEKKTFHKVVTGSRRVETYRPLSRSVVFGQAPETEG